MGQNEHCRHGHGYVGGQGGTGDAHVEHEDEQRVEDAVGGGAYYHCHHGPARIARGTHHVVEAEGYVGEQQAGKEYEHVCAGQGQGGGAGAEGLEQRVHAKGEQRYVHQAVDYGERQCVAKDVRCCVAVAGAEHDGYAAARSHTYEHSYGGGQVHQRESDGEAGDGVGAYPLAYEDAVDDVVESHHQHAHNGGEAVGPQQASYGTCGELFQARVH